MVQINSFRWRTNIPLPVSYQACQAIFKPRFVKHIKVGYTSTGYQMVEQRSLWKGPDNINVPSVGNTDHSYILIQ